jgi:hypothetical protein
MDPTALPTDNLYKFAALSGVALAGFLIWLTWKVQRELQAASLAITVKQRMSQVAVKRLGDLEQINDVKIAQMNAKFARLKADAVAGKLTEADDKRMEELKAEYKDAERDAAVRLDEQYKARKAQAKLGALVEGLQFQVLVFKRQKRQYIIATFAALAWSIVGFGLWYCKLQMPLDEKLKLEADVETIELQIKKAALARPVTEPGSSSARTQ